MPAAARKSIRLFRKSVVLITNEITYYMSQTLNILILGKDPTLFASTPGTTQDTRKRHIAYAAS